LDQIGGVDQELGRVQHKLADAEKDLENLNT
jgi:hypothetical protein